MIAAITALIAGLNQAGLIGSPRAGKEEPAAAAGSEPATSEAKLASAMVVPAQAPPTAPAQLAAPAAIVAPAPEGRAPAAALARSSVTAPRARANPSRPAAALLCRDANYGGLCRRVPTHRNLIGTVIENDTVSSLRLGTCAAVKVCTNIDLDGTAH